MICDKKHNLKMSRQTEKKKTQDNYSKMGT